MIPFIRIGSPCSRREPSSSHLLQGSAGNSLPGAQASCAVNRTYSRPNDLTAPEAGGPGRQMTTLRYSSYSSDLLPET